MRALVGVSALVSFALAFGVAGGVLAKDVRSSVSPPALVVQVPESAVIQANSDGGDTVFLQQGKLPMLTVGNESGDATALMAGTSAALDQVAGNFRDGVARSGLTVGAPAATGKTTVAGLTAYGYTAGVQSAKGWTADIQFWIIPIDAGHVAFVSVLGKADDPGVALLERDIRAATLSDR